LKTCHAVVDEAIEMSKPKIMRNSSSAGGNNSDGGNGNSIRKTDTDTISIQGGSRGIKETNGAASITRSSSMKSTHTFTINGTVSTSSNSNKRPLSITRSLSSTNTNNNNDTLSRRKSKSELNLAKELVL